jgi:hypothetical protein
MTPYAQFLKDIAQYQREHPTQRRGQAAFNYFAHVYPTLAWKYWGSIVDPFEDDSRLGAFLEAVALDMEEAA